MCSRLKCRILQDSVYVAQPPIWLRHLTLPQVITARKNFSSALICTYKKILLVLTTSSEQSDHGSRSSSYANFHTNSSQVLREPSKGELNDRFRIIITRAVEFITATDASPSINELQLTRRLFSILLHGLCSPLEKKNHTWSNTWSIRSALRKHTARIMVWLLEPHQSINTRVYAIRSLMEEPRAREILSCILEVHPQVFINFKTRIPSLCIKL